MAKASKTASVNRPNVWSLAQIDAAIASISKRGAALREDSHKCLVAIIDHYIANGDYTRLPKFLIAVRGSLGGSIAQSAAEWVQRYVTTLAYSEEAKKEQAKGPADKNMLGFVHVPKLEKKIKEDVERTIKDDKGRTVVVKVASAREIPFYELERHVEIRPFDLIATLQGILKRAEKAVQQNHDKEYEGPKHVITDEQFAKLKEMEELIESLKPSAKAKAKRTANANASKKAAKETATTAETPAETTGEGQGSPLGEQIEG